MNRNVPIMGFFIGLLLPVLGVLIVYLVMGSGDGLADFVGDMFKYKTAAALYLTLGLLINIAPFIYYTNKRLDHTARGILVATMLYAVLIILIKYVW